MQDRDISVGDSIVYHLPDSTPVNALVTAVHTKQCLNVVTVSNNENEKDAYGRQINRYTSVQHKSVWAVHGNYWRFTDEQPNEYVAPLAT